MKLRCAYCGEKLRISKDSKSHYKVECLNDLCGFESNGWMKRKFAIEAAQRRAKND